MQWVRGGAQTDAARPDGRSGHDQRGSTQKFLTWKSLVVPPAMKVKRTCCQPAALPGWMFSGFDRVHALCWPWNWPVFLGVVQLLPLAYETLKETPSEPTTLRTDSRAVG